MPNPAPQKPDLSASEELVAYLDGELSRDQSEAVERRIQDDKQARHELQQYDQVWNALDKLPQTTVKESFTKTTIELAAVDAKKSLAAQTTLLPVRHRNRRWQWAGMVAAGLVLGFTLVAIVIPNPNRTLYMHLPVITQIDAYNEVRDVEFLRALDANAGGWLQEEWGPQIGDEAEALTQITSASYHERRQRVAGLNDDDRTHLANKARRYSSLSPALRESINERYETIALAPDADKLQRTLLAYYAWVSQFPELEQAKLRSLRTDQRVAQVQKLQQRLEKKSDTRLTPANAVALREAFEALASDREIRQLHKTFVAALPRFGPATTPGRGPERMRRHRIEVLRKSQPRHTSFMILWIAAQKEAPFRDNSEAQVAMDAYRSAIERRLLHALDKETASRLRKKPARARSRQLALWLAETRHRKKPDVEALETYFVGGQIAPELQQELLSMPKDEMLRALERLYLRESLGVGDLGDDYWRQMRRLLDLGRDRAGPPHRGLHRDRPPPRPPMGRDRSRPPGRPDRP